MATNSSNYGTSFPSLSVHGLSGGPICGVPNSVSGAYNHATYTTSESGYYKEPAQWLPNVNPNNIAQPSITNFYKPDTVYKEKLIKCPTCGSCGGKQVVVNAAGKKYYALEDQITRWPQAIRKLVQGIDNIITGIIRTDTAASRFGGTCPTCKCENSDYTGATAVADPTGQTGQNALDAIPVYKEIAEPVTANERTYGKNTTGNRYTIIANNDSLDVGIGINDLPSYRIDPCGKAPGHITTAVPQVVVYHTSPTVQGTGPASGAPGGNYLIKCSNKFTCLAGTQGIDLITYGPVNIAGGQTKITGPDIVIGSSTGPVSIAGHHLQLTGETISIKPNGEGAQLIVQGSMGITGNAILGGGVHVDGDLSFTSATAPSKMDRTKYSSDWAMNTAMATWSGPAERRSGAPPLGYEQGAGGGNNTLGQALTFEVENFTRSLVAMTNDPSKMHESYRGFMTIADHNMHIAYLLFSTEWQPTGVCMAETFERKELKVYSKPGGKGKLVGYVKIEKMPMYNYPHQHQLFDGWHTHEVEVANINLLDSADEVRAVSAPKSSSVAYPAITPTDIDLMRQGPLID
jgi:hypothetical protein